MSDTLSRKVWIENFILSYARKYGSKFTRSTEQKGYRVQLIEFLTRRTPEHPDAAVWALASDGQYYIPVKFATNAVNQFRGIDGKLAILEDHWCGIFILKGTFAIQYSRIPRKYINGKPGGLEDAKKLYLEVTCVQYVGSMHEPIFVRPRVLKRDGVPDFVIQQEAVESVGNVAVVKKWMENLEKGDGDILKREWDAEEVVAKPISSKRLTPSVRAPFVSQPLPTANKRKEGNCTPSEHWPLFWKQAFKEHPWLFNSSSSEGSSDEEYLKEEDTDARYDTFVPILPSDEPFGPLVDMQSLDQPLEPGPSIPVPPISPVVLSIPHFQSSPSFILTDWSLTPPRLQTRSNSREDESRSPVGAVLGNGGVEPEGKADNSMISMETTSPLLEEGNTTSSSATRTEYSASYGALLEADEVNNQVSDPSSIQVRLGKERRLGVSSLRSLQLSPRQTRKHRGELRAEYSAAYTVPMHPTKRSPIPKFFPPSQTLFSEPQATLTQEHVPASVGESSQDITSSNAFRIPPGQMAIIRESQQSRSTQECAALESPIDAFVEGFSWEIMASQSTRFLPSGQVAVTQGSQETGPVLQNTGEAKTSFNTPDPLANREHRWKSKNVNVMLSSSPIYPTSSVLNSPAAETSLGPMDSASPLSDSDIAYHQYMEDNRIAKGKEGSPASSEEETGSQLEIDGLRDDVSSKAPSADSSDESDEGTDNKQEGPTKPSIIMPGEEQLSSSDVEVDEQQRLSQRRLEEQKAGLTPGPEAPPAQSERSVEELLQSDEGEELQEPAHIEEGDYQKRSHERLSRIPTQVSLADFLGELKIMDVKAAQRGAKEAQAEVHQETEADDAIRGGNDANNHGKGGIGRVLLSGAHETRLSVESITPLETANEELQDVGLQQESLRTHLQSPLMVITPTYLHRPEPQVSKTRPRAPRRLPWLLAESDDRSPSASTTSPPPPSKQRQVLGKRKRISVGDDVREQARTQPPPSILKIPVEKANFSEILLQPTFQHRGGIKRRKVEFVDTPLEIDFEESGSDSDEIPIDDGRPRTERVEKAPAPAIQVRDGSPFSRNKPSRPPNFDVPSPLSSVSPRGASIPGVGKVHLSKPPPRADHPASSMVPSSSVKDQQPMALSANRSRRVSAQPNTAQQRPTSPASSRASARYPPPVSSLFRGGRSFRHRSSTSPRYSLSHSDHPDFSDFRDDMSVLSTDSLPHVDFLKRKSVTKGTSSTRCSRR